MITATQTETSTLKAEYNLGYVWLISIVAAMGGLLFGWDWVVIGGAKPFFQRYFQLTSEAQIGWANSCALIGCLVGALAAGALASQVRHANPGVPSADVRFLAGPAKHCLYCLGQ